MDLYAEYAVDDDKVENGAKIYFEDGSWIRIRHFDSVAVQEEIRRIEKPYGKTGVIPADERDIVQARKVAACIAGWDGITEKGKPFPYSPENAVYIVKTYKPLRNRVTLIASQWADFRADDALEMVGNSNAPSNGKSSGPNNESGSAN